MLAVVVTVAADGDDVELASDRLWALGVVAIEERHGERPGTVELWTSLGEQIADVELALMSMPHRWPWRVVTVDEAVVDTWRDHAEPTWVADDLVVVPSWRPPPELPDGVVAIAIDPGATFGMGDHPTTVLSLRCLQRVTTAGGHVLDVGCGSGVLAIAASLFGAEAATAIDISPAAVPVATQNALRNGVADRISVSTTPLAEIEGSYTVVLANILAPTLIDLADDLVRVLDDGGSLIISGILVERHDHVLRALAPLRVVDRLELDGWVALILRA